MVLCCECKGFMVVGGADEFHCAIKDEPIDRKLIYPEMVEIECDQYKEAPRHMNVRLRDYREAGMTTVYGNGSVQIPSAIREDLGIKDGDKILWIREDKQKYSFRKVGYKPSFKPHYT